MDANILHELFEYRDGKLYWKISRGRTKAGKEAGRSKKLGYREIRVYGKLYLTHRLIFNMFNGYEPKVVDHIDGNPANNKIENLRAATCSQNLQNSKTYISNSSGIKGVGWSKKGRKWQVKIQVKNKEIWLGYYDDLELAGLVAEEARNKYHGEFANHG
jgi:hypothetical protein